MTTMASLKSNETSNECRAKGNKFYSSRKFFEALINYNESLSFAEVGTENLGLAYANRSAVYFEMKLYDHCLRNVELAKQNNYPEKNFEILNKREEKCKEHEKSQARKSPWNFFKLSYPPNKKVPFIVDCLEVKCDEKFGRHIITNRSLKVGDVLSIEEPFCGVLLSESNMLQIPDANILQRCSYCLKENALDLIPCQNCCKAMFCSDDCQTKSFKRYHQYECPIMHQLIRSGSVHMALRLFFVAISTFDGSVENLEAFLNENKTQKSTIFDFDFKTSGNEKDRQLLLSLMSLISSSKSFPLHSHEEILKNHPTLNETWEKHEKFIKSFLLRQCQTSDLNFHGIFSGNSQITFHQNPTDVLCNMQQSIGSGSMLFASLFNHSCANNVLRICVEGKIIYVVCRPIERGSQLFDCYKVNFMKQQKPERQAKLVKDFGFKCDCEACVNNYPTPPTLTFKDMKLLKFAKKADDEILTMQTGQAMKKFRDCCDILEKNHQTFPCVELCLLLKCIATFLLSQAQPAVLFP